MRSAYSSEHSPAWIRTAWPFRWVLCNYLRQCCPACWSTPSAGFRCSSPAACSCPCRWPASARTCTITRAPFEWRPRRFALAPLRRRPTTTGFRCCAFWCLRSPFRWASRPFRRCWWRNCFRSSIGAWAARLRRVSVISAHFWASRRLWTLRWAFDGI